MLNDFFRRFAGKISHLTGNVWVFVLALVLISTWLMTGPLFNFSNTWQLMINTFTTVVTFLMVFIIQNTQNRDNKALHLKLDELLRAVRGAKLGLVDVDEFTDEELDKIQDKFKKLERQSFLSVKKSPLT